MISASVSAVPELAERQEEVTTYSHSDEEQKRGLRVHRRIDQMLEARAPYENGMRRGLLLFDGINLADPKDASNLRNDNIVAPFARIFVESKLSEEVKAFSEYQFTPVEDSGDAWKVDLLKDVNTHIRRVTKQSAKRHQILRMKDIVGIGIARVGYRRIMGMRKIRVEGNEDGDIDEYIERPVPIYDDLFLDVVSPFNFAVDPNATSMDDAMDCVHFHYENFENFWEMYANDDKFKNTQHVLPGKHGKFSDKGYTAGTFRSYSAQENLVLIAEYFNKVRDEWVVYANGIEIYCGPLPDDHKELPFVSYHNNPSFATGFVELSLTSSTGEEISATPDVKGEEGFWTIGDPATIMDLIELRSAHGRAAHRAMKRASQVIVATRGNFSMPKNRKWMDGDEVKGGAGQIEVLPLGMAQSGNWQWAFDDLFQLMRLTTGVDPSNLADTKGKTATEALVQRETSMRRLDQNIEYNEEHGEIRMGMLIHKLIQQRYTKPEIVRLLGNESEEDLKRFDAVEKDEATGTPLYGKRYRRIKSKYNIVEHVKGGKYKMEKDDAGVSSFIARPEYIRTSDIDIGVSSGRRAGQIKALEGERAMKAIELFTNLYPLTQPDPMTGKAVLDKEDMPNMRALVEKLMWSMDMDMDKDIGQDRGETKTDTEKKAEAYKQLSATRTPLTTIPTANGTTTATL